MRNRNDNSHGRKEKPVEDAVADMADTLQNPAVVANAAGTVVVVNAAACLLLATSKGELVGLKLDELQSDHRDWMDAGKIRSMLDRQGFYNGYMIVKPSSGDECLVSVVINRIGDRRDEQSYIYVLSPKKEWKLDEYKELLRLKNDIYQDYKLIVNVSDLSRRNHVCYSHVIYLFKCFEGKSPKEFLNDYKIELCKKMIGEGELAFKEIAFELGFRDVHHLAKVFKASTSMTMSEYQDQAKGQAGGLA